MVPSTSHSITIPPQFFNTTLLDSASIKTVNGTWDYEPWLSWRSVPFDNAEGYTYQDLLAGTQYLMQFFARSFECDIGFLEFHTDVLACTSKLLRYICSVWVTKNRNSMRPNCALDRRTVLCLYVPGFHRQVFKYVPKFKWFRVQIPVTQTLSGHLFCCGFRNCKWIPRKVNEIRKWKWNPQNLLAESANVKGFRKL